MTTIRHRMVNTNGIQLHVAEAGEGPLVLLVHGFPEGWYAWRHQLRALAAAGYHAVAPDVRGYGQSDKPAAVEAYSMKALMGDFTGLLDALGAETAVIVGHDWGSAMAWNSAALFPERYRAVVGMSVPHMGRAPLPPTQLFASMFGERWFYILYFQQPGVAEAELEADVAWTMRSMLAGTPGFDMTSPIVQAKRKGDTFLSGLPSPANLPDWLRQEDLDHFTQQFQRGGFAGPINRYRNMDRDWHELPQLADLQITQPALFITGERDPVRTFSPVATMQKLVPNLRPIVVVPGAGHWVQQERPDEINGALLSFLAELRS